MLDTVKLSSDVYRQALTEVLDSETLRHSDQLRKILQFICEAAIEGRGAQITETVIAIDVLNRVPSSNSADDSSVRSRIYALRKKLAHYYEIENPSAPIGIEIPKGCYVPRFSPRIRQGGLQNAIREKSRLWMTTGLVILLLLVGAAVSVLHLRQSSTLDVWAPLIDLGKKPVLVSVGAGEVTPGSSQTQSTGSLNEPIPNDYRVSRVGAGDARALFRLGVLLGQFHVASELRFSSTTSFQDLHSSPTVLLSAFNNQFTLEATSNLRYHFAPYNRLSGQIEDSKQPSAHWRLNVNQHGQVIGDYGIAARLMGQPQREPMIIAAGLEQCGTEASLELLTDAVPQLVQRMPAGWKHKNFEVLLGVNVVNGSCGNPEILRLEVW